jgi:hypothetical protein
MPFDEDEEPVGAGSGMKHKRAPKSKPEEKSEIGEYMPTSKIETSWERAKRESGEE